MINKVREVIKSNNLDAILINSTNEYLVEYNLLSENARYKLTGFTGSTGDAVVTKEGIFLFVDGRYHIQADEEVDSSIVTVVKLQTGDTFLSKLKDILPEGSILGMHASKNSQSRVENTEKYYKVELLDFDGIEVSPPPSDENSEKISIMLCGKSSENKILEIKRLLGDDDCLLISNPEEVSYLFNIRDFSRPYSAKVFKRAIILKNDNFLFGYKDFDNYKKVLSYVKGKIYADKLTINARDFSIIKDRAECFSMNPISEMKAIKTESELEHYKDAFRKTDLAIKAIRKYIEDNDNISEYDIAQKLEEEFKKFGAKSLSFNSIVAKDKNSALAHYSKSSKDEIISDGSLILIDCGAYYEGGLATDITRAFVKGEPNSLQKRVYTSVLKAFLNAFNTKIVKGISGFDIDSKVRKIFEKNPIEGFVFNHGLGHGIGINVHEIPPNLSCNEVAKTELKNNMCFTIEPGLYNKDHFGVRLENSCYIKDNKIHSFVNMNYERKLIDYNELSEQEIIWLNEFEVL